MTNKRNYQPLIAGRVPGKSPSVVVGREQELERHFDKIEIEFAGKPKLCFHLAKVIVLIRREVDLEKNVDEFFTILYQHVGLLCQYMSTRWLIAICDTVADHGSPVQKASALMMLGDKVSAEEAERLGMVYKVVSEGDFLETVEKTANTLSHMPTLALGDTTKLLNASMDNSMEQQLDMESKFQIESAQSEDYAEGVAAFVEKRKPVFKGK